MPTSKPNNPPKTENLKSILHSPHNTNNNDIIVNSGRSRSNSQRTLPFCVHGDLFGRHPGASYHCRSDHHSRPPTPIATPHSQRLRNPPHQDGGATARRGSWTNDNEKDADFFCILEEEKG